MGTTLRTYVDLVRLPNLVTAAADVLAAYLFMGGTLARWPTLLGLMLASVCLYAGGVALNDVCDVAQDQSERPSRPIPSGRISRHRALWAAVSLIVLGVLVAAWVSWRSGIVAAMLATAVILYDTVAKKGTWGPAIMGACRALNWSLALVWADAALTPAVGAVVALVGLYVTSVTFFAGQEAEASDRRRLLIGTVGICAAAGGLCALPPALGIVRWGDLPAFATLLGWLGYWGVRASARRTANAVQRSVKVYVLSLILFDAAIVLTSRGWLPASFVAAMVAPAWLLGRTIRVT